MGRIEQVIAALEVANRPSRKLDWAIGELLGWSLQVEEGIDPQTGNPTRKENWVSPETGEFAKVPEYTALIDRAIGLTQEISKGAHYGVGFADGRFRGQVADGDVCYGRTAAIALCIAALKLKARQGRG